MNYFISRENKQYGPYTLADLQRYVASGEVLITDFATSEGMAAAVPVGQIIGNIAAPPTYPASAAFPVATVYPAPPNMHWGLVLLLAIVTCGIFGIVWEIIQASWAKKVAPASKSFTLYLVAAGLLVCIFFASFFTAMNHSSSSFTSLLQITYYVMVLVARFSFKATMESHYNQAEPMGLSLSGAMTFFFGGIYFQYHFNNILKRKTLEQIYGPR